MAYFKELTDFAATFDIKLAVVQVRPGESNTVAWTRHLKDHPLDANAMVKIFNQPRITNN
jgi:hypothetical protein